MKCTSKPVNHLFGKCDDRNLTGVNLIGVSIITRLWLNDQIV
jgi:hypothetical protein